MKNETANEITISRTAARLLQQFISKERMMWLLTELGAKDAHSLLDLWRV